MKKILILSLICIFSLWLLPLAAFVKPSQDALICEGRRAICLCRQTTDNSRQPSVAEAMSYQAGQSQNNKDVSGGMSPRFLTGLFSPNVPVEQPSFFWPDNRLLYSFRFIPSCEHVPKA